ncbi:hypothetical protein C4D60_Mb01t21550 [Musa balbisiana]|uniref:Uncharacterized protein n=1 Tax=Musa balbisiana TaxID=52838 RepID=A0A4S8JQF7_MUSBA|nr:hypothetical protein C4D60_Mb01t21550 [Musa balbisiana]
MAAPHPTTLSHLLFRERVIISFIITSYCCLSLTALPSPMKGGGSVGGERRGGGGGGGKDRMIREREGHAAQGEGKKEALSLRGMLSGSRSFVSLTDYADLCEEISDQASFPPTIASVSPPLDPRHRSFHRLGCVSIFGSPLLLLWLTPFLSSR